MNSLVYPLVAALVVGLVGCAFRNPKLFRTIALPIAAMFAAFFVSVGIYEIGVHNSLEAANALLIEQSVELREAAVAGIRSQYVPAWILYGVFALNVIFLLCRLFAVKIEHSAVAQEKRE